LFRCIGARALKWKKERKHKRNKKKTKKRADGEAKEEQPRMASHGRLSVNKQAIRFTNQAGDRRRAIIKRDGGITIRGRGGGGGVVGVDNGRGEVVFVRVRFAGDGEFDEVEAVDELELCEDPAEFPLGMQAIRPIWMMTTATTITSTGIVGCPPYPLRHPPHANLLYFHLH